MPWFQIPNRPVQITENNGEWTITTVENACTYVLTSPPHMQ